MITAAQITRRASKNSLIIIVPYPRVVTVIVTRTWATTDTSTGIVLLVIGAGFMVLGALGHAVGGRSHYY